MNSKKNNPKRPRKRKSSFADRGAAPPSEPTKSASTKPGLVFRWELILVFVVVAFGGILLQRMLRPLPSVPYYDYEVVNKYVHDSSSFTQGLLLNDGIVWESTGKYGQ